MFKYDLDVCRILYLVYVIMYLINHYKVESLKTFEEFSIFIPKPLLSGSQQKHHVLNMNEKKKHFKVTKRKFGNNSARENINHEN